MTLRAFYRTAAVGPLLGLAVAAALARPSPALPAGWDWVYPGSLARGLVIYTLLTIWLWIEIGRRSGPEIRRLAWWIPPVYVLLGWLLMLGLALGRGAVAELWEEHAGAILLRTAVHLAVGYGYVALVQVALGALRDGGRISEPT